MSSRPVVFPLAAALSNSVARTSLACRCCSSLDLAPRSEGLMRRSVLLPFLHQYLAKNASDLRCWWTSQTQRGASPCWPHSRVGVQALVAQAVHVGEYPCETLTSARRGKGYVTDSEHNKSSQYASFKKQNETRNPPLRLALPATNHKD